MFGKVIETKENFVIVENIKHEINTQIKNIHVSFEEQNRTIIGKVSNITLDTIEIFLLGEIQNNKFTEGIYKYPLLNKPPRIITGNELVTMTGSQNLKDKNTLLIGSSTTYPNFKITCNLTNMFSNHFAIIGNSGFGKSCGTARIIQNLFNHEGSIPKNAHIVMFDVYGEYDKPFKALESIEKVHVKSYKNSKNDYTNVISLPAYFLDAEDLAILLDIDDSSLIPVLEKTLKYTKIFTSKDEKTIDYKNSIIAKTLLELLLSGKSSAQIRDQVISILNKYHTDTLNLESKVVEPGYTRTIRQCLLIDEQGKINAIGILSNYLNKFTEVDTTNIDIPINTSYSLDDIYYALEFALLSEGAYNSELIYEKSLALRVHLYQILNSEEKKFFTYDKYITKKEYVENLFKTGNNEPIQIINISLDEIDDRLAKVLTKLYSKLFFNYALENEDRASFPINIILEEAHRYVNNDNDTRVIGYNIFDRITKEGRKYGVLMGFITQRPKELSETALSQCSNFLVFRIFHPDDYKIVDSITSSLTRDDLERLKTLRKGMALTFGQAFALPMIAQVDLPNPLPQSSNANIIKTWF